MTNNDRVIAFGLLTKNDLDRLGSNFSRAFPIEETPCFGGLLAAIDEAEREHWRERDAQGEIGSGEPRTDPKINL